MNQNQIKLNRVLTGEEEGLENVEHNLFTDQKILRIYIVQKLDCKFRNGYSSLYCKIFYDV